MGGGAGVTPGDLGVTLIRVQPRAKPSLAPHLRIRLLQSVNRVLARVYHDVQVSGATRLPRTGAAIVISNHISSLDPLLIQSVVDRPIAWMVAREYYEAPALKWLFEGIQAIPVSRDGRDSSALRAAFRTLEAGRVLGIFPEGRIQLRPPAILPFQSGVAMIAVRSGAPVIPVYQTGTTAGLSMVRAVLLPQFVRVRFGSPIDLKAQGFGGRDLTEAAQFLQSAVHQLQRQPTAGQ
ncbi:MAG: 1-acyl-sn-glycerol-3-phosphate acyltransferase [Burkholderiales bacterium]|nr:1-acyl-sn-glycerol-3-phosphate acyltransferase [Phycisphaerae bacterium]